MEKSKIKMTLLFKIFCCLLLGIFIIGCSNEVEQPDCGCESEILETIPETSEIIGELFYKTQSNDPMDTYYNNTFWIVYQEENCSNCIHSMIVCNEDLIKNKFGNVLNNNEIIQVKFSGHLKEICKKTFAPADYTYQRIILTSIEKQ